jgi:hypothetical protein
MTFWQFLTNVYSWTEDRFTRILGVAGGTITILLSSNVIPASQIKWYTAAIAVLTFWRGQSTANTVAAAKSIVAVDKASDLPKVSPSTPK